MSKKNYFGTAIAMLAMLASCSQDELSFVAERPVGNNLDGRREVGAVTFVNGAETRFDYMKELAEVGDVLGVFLMDTYNTESWDDATDYNPRVNSHWWSMYTLTNYISNAYGYTYEGDGKWTNQEASLVEGNYFVTFPYNEETNTRSGLWHKLEPNNTLTRTEDATWVKGDRKNVYTNFENTYYIGYKRIYRDDKVQQESEELKQDILLFAASSDMHFVIANQNAGTNYRIKKVAIRKKDGSEVSTLAYVHPEGFDKRNSEQYNTNIAIHDNWFNQLSARAVVTFENVLEAREKYDYMPNNDAAQDPVYEFGFKLPETNGFVMNASAPRLDVYMSVPVSTENDLQKYEAIIYADKLDQNGHWAEGVFTHGVSTSSNDGKWTLGDILSGGLNGLSKGGMSVPVANLNIDNSCWTPYTNSGNVIDTDDLIDKIKDCKEQMAADGINEQILEVNLYGQSVEITDEILGMLVDDNYDGKQIKQDITLDIKTSRTNYEQRVMYRAAKLIDNIRCASTVPMVIGNDNSVECNENVAVSIVNYGSLTLGKDASISKLTNGGVFNMHGQVGEVINFGEVTASDNAKARVFHNGELYRATGALVVYNLSVTEGGYNCSNISVEGTLDGFDKFSNYGTMNINNGIVKIKSTTWTSNINVNNKNSVLHISGINVGTIETKGQVYLYDGNRGTISITEKIADAEASVIYVNPQTYGEGIILNNVLAPVQNQPAYPLCKHIVVKETLDNFTTALADIEGYNGNNLGGNINGLQVTSKAPLTGTLPNYIKEAELNIDTDDASGTLTLGSAKVSLTGNATIKSGHEWIVTGENVTDNMYIVVEKGARLSGGALTADVDNNK